MPATARANSTTAICMPRQMPEVRDRAFAGDPRRLNLALDPALAETAGNEDPVGAGSETALGLRSSESTSSTSTLTPWWMPPCLSASITDL